MLHRLDGPRGIVAASTAATFSSSLAAEGAGGAAGIPPLTFPVIVATAVLSAGSERQRNRARDAGLNIAPGELLAAATGRGAEPEGITSVMILTAEDDCNALASIVLADTLERSPHHDLQGHLCRARCTRPSSPTLAE